MQHQTSNSGKHRIIAAGEAASLEWGAKFCAQCFDKLKLWGLFFQMSARNNLKDNVQKMDGYFWNQSTATSDRREQSRCVFQTGWKMSQSPLNPPLTPETIESCVSAVLRSFTNDSGPAMVSKIQAKLILPGRICLSGRKKHIVHFLPNDTNISCKH